MKGAICMGINIIKTTFAWAGMLRAKNKPEYIILHHAEASECTILDIDTWHKARGWIGIGYQYLVRKDGSIYEGRPEWAEGAHCIPYNCNSIGICTEGNYETETMPEAQREAIIALIKDIRNRHAIKKVYGHGQVWNTSCPGKNYPLQSIIELSNNVAVTVTARISTVTTPGKEAVKAIQQLCNNLGIKDERGKVLDVDGKVGMHTRYAVDLLPLCGIPYKQRQATAYIQRQLNVWGYSCGKVDGVFFIKTEAAVRLFQENNSLKVDGIVGQNTWRKFLELAKTL